MFIVCLVLLTSCNTRSVYFFFFNDTATTEIYTLSLHDALPILRKRKRRSVEEIFLPRNFIHRQRRGPDRSEEHTSELQSRQYLVCRLLLEKKKTTTTTHNTRTGEANSNHPIFLTQQKLKR